ncbi:MAG TPA: HAMP domain-containing sensor histidine kinase, partial [Acidobacteriaceae bacterium]|nr:HAMP domain-containing sensor histidine kinase [Acidobacteriaceae bacterium]
DMAQEEIARVSQITQQTLRFYRQSSSPTLIQPADVLDSVLDLHHGRANAAKVQTIRRYRNGAELYAFSGEMRQLFANFVGNALDAMPNGGKMYLSVRASQAWYQPEVEGVRITIADTGSGMTEAVRERIFEPFFTTKEITGTGLGLWISSEIIAKHQGTVRVRSRAVAIGELDIEQGNGSTVLDDVSNHAHSAQRKSDSGTVFMLFFPFNGLADNATIEES